MHVVVVIVVVGDHVIHVVDADVGAVTSRMFLLAGVVDVDVCTRCVCRYLYHSLAGVSCQIWWLFTLSLRILSCLADVVN